MAGSNWFGDLQLAYKYIVVFCSLLVLTFLAGLIKVLIDRRKLKNIVKKEELEAGPKEDQVELNQREKDEGDLFGIRAIEAGFYAGVAQSRPVSRAGSVSGTPAMSSNTLVGGVHSPLMKGHSANNSVLSLNLGSNSQQSTRPTTKLSPSEAELTGRHGAVDMSLQVPPSPGLPRGSPSPTGSDSGDEYMTPRGNPQRSQDFHPQHYSPAPTIPMPDALQVTYHDVQDTAKSQAASFNSSPATTPPPPGNPPATRLPTIPTAARHNGSRSPSPEFSYQPRAQATTEPAQLTTVPTPQPQAPAPAHKRDASDASSMYSQKRMSTFDAYQAFQKKDDHSTSAVSNDTYNYGFSSTDESRGTSMVLSVDNNQPDRSSHLAPPNSQDSRLSEFYEAYYRNSQVGAVQTVEAKCQVGRHSTIVEVDTPLASPMFAKSMQHPPPGAAF